MHVAVAELPIRERVARDRLHLHVVREQVVAGVRAILGDAFEKEIRVDSLAHETPVEVGEDDDDRIDLIGFDPLRELLEIETARRCPHRDPS